MSTIYAESSAVLRWLLGADGAALIQDELGRAGVVISSALTSAEVARTLRRLVATGTVDPGVADGAWARYLTAMAHWHLYAVSDAVLSRVALPFPREPVRTLDAIHLATASLFSLEVMPTVVLSVDQPLRDNAVGLGLAIAPGVA